MESTIFDYCIAVLFSLILVKNYFCTVDEATKPRASRPSAAVETTSQIFLKNSLQLQGRKKGLPSVTVRCNEKSPRKIKKTEKSNKSNKDG